MTTMKKLLTLAGAALMTFGCDFGTRLDTRTFEVDYLRPDEAGALVDPYVYGNRTSAPGVMSVLDGAITVRETPDNLDRIAEVLAEFDRPRPDTRLHFQLIEADGFTTSDPRIAEVEDELRRIFRFQGYRLAGEATVTATDNANFQQGLSGTDGMYEISGDVYRTAGDAIRLGDVQLVSENGWTLATSVNVRPGQTVVLGSQPKSESTATLFLTVRMGDDGGNR